MLISLLLLLLITSTTISAIPGFQLGDPSLGVDIVVQTNMTQCASFLVFFQITQQLSPRPSVALYTRDLLGDPFLSILLPGEGGTVTDWMCNIPAGRTLTVAVADPGKGFLRGKAFLVQNGGRECLGEIGSIVFPEVDYNQVNSRAVLVPGYVVFFILFLI